MRKGHRFMAWHGMSHQRADAASHLSGMSEVPSATPCSAERDFSSGIPTFSRKQSAGSARMALYLSYPDKEQGARSEVMSEPTNPPWASDSHLVSLLSKKQNKQKCSFQCNWNLLSGKDPWAQVKCTPLSSAWPKVKSYINNLCPWRDTRHRHILICLLFWAIKGSRQVGFAISPLHPPTLDTLLSPKRALLPDSPVLSHVLGKLNKVMDARDEI